MKTATFVSTALAIFSCASIAQPLKMDKSVVKDEIHCEHHSSHAPDRTTYERINQESLDLLQMDRSGSLYGMGVQIPIHGGRICEGLLIDGFEYPLGGWYGWGLLDDDQGGFFAIAVKGSAIQATVYRGSAVYNIRKPAAVVPDSKGRVKVEVNSFNSGSDVVHMPGYELVRENAVSRGVTNTIIDHLYVYSSGLESGIGDFDGDSTPDTRDDAVARMMLSVSELSLIYVASDIQVTARLAYAYASDITDSYLPSLSELAGTTDGYVDEINSVRDLVKADLGNYKRYVGNSVGGGSTSQGYSTFDTTWLTRGTIGNQTIGGGNGHEVGHSMGMAHGRNGTLTPHSSVPYAYGYCVGPVANRSTMMLGCTTPSGPVLLQYSNSALTYSPTGEAMGIDHAVDPFNSADGARAHNLTAPIIADFRTGTPEYPDCDGDGVLDVIEIAQGTASDCNGNGIDDACDISSGFETDCDSNGIPDSCEYTTELFVERTRSSQILGLTTSRSFDFDGEPSVNSPLEVTFATSAALNAVTSIDIYVDGVLAGTLLDSGTTTTSCGTGTSDSFVYSAHDGDIQTVELSVNGGNLNDSIACVPNASIKLTYHTDEPSDINRNGVYDPCEPGCTPYDIAAPYGSLNYFDISLYQSWYNSGDLLADFAEPYGEINYQDMSAFLNGYGAGCP